MEERWKNVKFIESVFSREKPWRKRLSMMVSLIVCLLAVAVSSFLLWGPYKHQDAAVIPLHPGWNQIAIYSHTGGITIAEQNITLPHLWGYVLSCSGKGEITIDVTGNRTMLKIGNNSCSASPHPHESPQFIEFDLQALHIQQVKVVTASANITWRLQFVQETKGSTFQINPDEWVGQIGMSSTSDDASTSELGNGVPVTAPNGQTIVPKTWGLIIACIGKGTGSAQFTPSVGTITFPPCDGIPRMRIVKYPTPTTVLEVQIKPAGHITSYVGLVACIDEQKCTSSSVS
jgi:hypothetical protein